MDDESGRVKKFIKNYESFVTDKHVHTLQKREGPAENWVAIAMPWEPPETMDPDAFRLRIPERVAEENEAP